LTYHQIIKWKEEIINSMMNQKNLNYKLSKKINKNHND